MSITRNQVLALEFFQFVMKAFVRRTEIKGQTDLILEKLGTFPPQIRFTILTERKNMWMEIITK